MSCQYYCNPCPPCCNPCYPPCCTLCYFPYLVCCNPCCPIKPCAPSPPKKTQKLTDFANTGPPDSGKNKEAKKKETKNVKGKEEKEKKVKEKKEKEPKKSGGKNPARKGSPVAKNVTSESEPITVGPEKKEKEKGDQNPVPPPPTDSGRPSPPQPGVKADTGGKESKEKPATMAGVPGTKKVEPREPGEVVEGTGAGDGGGPPRKVICKCFAKQGGPCTPRPPCRCSLKPPQICTPNLLNPWTLKSPHICTPKPHICTPKPPPHIFPPKLCCKCMAKLQGAAFPPSQDRAKQFGSSQMYPGGGRAMSSFAGNLAVTPFPPKMQVPRTAPSSQKRGRSPGTCVCKSKSRSPFAGEGFYTCTVASETPPSTQTSKRVCEKYLQSGDVLMGQNIQKYIPEMPRASSLQSKPYSYGGGYNRLPSAGDGLLMGTSKCAKCANKQRNASMLPSGYDKRQPEASRMYQNSSYTKPSSEYTRAICSTCGSIKFKPKVPVPPKKPQDCCLKGFFAIE